MTNKIETDYLVVGSGATAMAFVDSLLSESDASITIVDRYHRPGGHWNVAYPFVKLHQPSEWYGVASRELSTWYKEQGGVNEGMNGLASGAQVLAHFDQVMQQRFLPSGRVQWFPMSEYAAAADGTHRFRSVTSGQEHEVVVKRKLVNATHAATAVPSTHAPKYDVGPGVVCIPVNRLPEVRRPYLNYTVVGSGKTGMDACLWLLENGVPAQRIRWLMPRDAWMMDRANFQPGIENFERSMGSTIAQLDAIAAASSVPDLFGRLEQSGQLLRLDPSVQPTTYRCAVVSRGELAQLRRIGDVVRQGHVKSIEPHRIVLERGEVVADPDTLYIDCSACAIQMAPDVPVFDGDTINLLMVRTCQPLFSGALIAYVESHLDGDAAKNAMCRPVPGPERPIDWVRMWAVTLANTASWRQHAGLQAWLRQCRLHSLAVMMRGMQPGDTAQMALLKEAGMKSAAAAAKLPALLATAA